MIIKKCLKQPVIVEAVEYSLPNKPEDIAKWCGGAVMPDMSILIDTLEGLVKATPGDFIIKGVKGEFYPCKPDIFWKTYEVVSE